MNMRGVPRYTLVWGVRYTLGAHYLSKNTVYILFPKFCEHVLNYTSFPIKFLCALCIHSQFLYCRCSWGQAVPCQVVWDLCHPFTDKNSEIIMLHSCGTLSFMCIETTEHKMNICSLFTSW